MKVEPKIREFICTTAHPEGCREYVRRQIAYVRSQERKKGRKQEPKKVLVIGASTGYGLASRIHRAGTIRLLMKRKRKKRDFMRNPLMAMLFQKL